MSKILAESLYEFRKTNNSEELNEAIQPGKTFRQGFLKAGHALAKAGREDQVKTIWAWAKKLNSMGWPKEGVLRKELGDKFKSFMAALNLVNKMQPSFGATAGGTTTSQKGGDIGKSTEERLAVVSKALGVTADELKDVLTK